MGVICMENVGGQLGIKNIWWGTSDIMSLDRQLNVGGTCPPPPPPVSHQMTPMLTVDILAKSNDVVPS